MRTFIRSIPFALLGFLFAMASGCSRRARVARQLASADHDFAAGNYDRAEIEYLNVLRLQGLNPQAIGRLGAIYFDQGRVGRAIAFLLKGQELQPDNPDIRNRLGMVYLANGKLQEARDEADAVLKRHPLDERAPLLLAEAAYQPKDVEEARKRLEDLPPPAPNTAPVLAALATFDFRERHFKEAEAKLLRAKALDPKLPAIYSGLGALYWTQNEPTRADQEYQKAAELSPPRSPRWLQYAQFKIQTGQVDAGRQLLQEMTKRAPDYLPAWLRLAELTAAEKKYDDAEALVGNVLARDSTNLEGLLIDGRMKLAKLEIDKALAVFQRAHDLYPRSAPACFELGRAYTAKGDITKAVDNLGQAVLLAPNYPDAILLLADINIRRGSYGAAITALGPLVKQWPHLLQAQALLATAYRANGNLEDSLATYRGMEAELPRDPTVPMALGGVLLQLHRADEARQAFVKATEIAPDFPPAVEQLVNLDLRARQFTEARQLVEQLIAKDPKKAPPYLLLARVFAAQRNTEKAETSLKKAIELQPDQAAPYFMLAELYLGANQQNEALANLEKVIAKDPKNITALMLVAMLYDQKKEYPAARNAYEKLIEINPKFGPALNNLAYLYAEQLGQLDKALALAERARDALPNDPNTADTLGWILYQERHFQRAATLVQESAGKRPDDPEIQFHLGMTYYTLGQEGPARAALERALHLNSAFPGASEARSCLAILAIDPASAGGEARSMLEKAVAQRKDDPVALVRLAAIYERGGQTEKAMRILETAKASNPDNVSVLLSLARLYAANHEAQQARDLAESARKLAPDDTAVLHTLGNLAFQTGDYTWAASLLQQAARQQSNDASLLIDTGNAVYATGRIQDAITAMQNAQAANADIAQADRARMFLAMTALAADPAKAVAEAAAVGQLLKSNPSYVPALMAQAVIDETKDDFTAAIATYNKVLAIYPDFSPAKRCLAIIYAEHPADDQKAYDLAVKAREAFPGDSELAKAFGIIVYRRGDFSRAASLLQESAGQLTNDSELLYYLGMAQYQANRHAESKRALQRALDLGLSGRLAAQAKNTLAAMK